MFVKYVVLPDEKVHRLPFYLAMEEFLARHGGVDDDLFFMWQVRPTVIFGRNQVIENEVNLSYCRQHGIEVYRRKSGGGCVYADMGNVMFSYVTKSENVNLTFNRFINMVVLVLRKAGVEATSTSHNDVLVPPLGASDSPSQAEGQWRKVSGTAFFHVPGASIVHGTLLYDTTMEHMVSAITPSGEKLAKHGVESVRQRIGLLKDYTAISIDELKALTRQTLCQGELLLTDADVAAIEAIEQTYLDEDFIMGCKKGK